MASKPPKSKVARTTRLVRTLHESVNYPPHPPRTPTREYIKTHHELVVVKDLPCLVCGVRNSTLKDPKQNPFQATALETHHRYIEDSLANAISLEKFNSKIPPALLRKSGNAAKYGHSFTQEEMLAWIHGDPDQMWILCSQHHRNSFVGIHGLTAPIFGVQDLLIDGYNLTNFVPTTPHEGIQLENLPATTGKVASVESPPDA